MEERGEQQLPCNIRCYTALLHVEQCRLVDLSCTRAVRAFDIVGIDLQLRLRLHRGSRREQDVSVRLLSLGVLRMRCYDQFAQKSAFGFVLDSELQQLVRLAVRHAVSYARVNTDLLLAAEYSQAVDVRLGMLACLLDVQHYVMADVSIFLQAEQVNSQHTVCLLNDLPLCSLVRHMADHQVLLLARMYYIFVQFILTFHFINVLNSSLPFDREAGGGSFRATLSPHNRSAQVPMPVLCRLCGRSARRQGYAQSPARYSPAVAGSV